MKKRNMLGMASLEVKLEIAVYDCRQKTSTKENQRLYRTDRKE